MKKELELEILLPFFNSHQYAGWKGIATTLIDQGECVVAGDECIWIGGIGNFIKTETADSFIGCLKYNFNKEEFLKSEWAKETISHIIGSKEKYKTQLAEKLASVDVELKELHNIIKK